MPEVEIKTGETGPVAPEAPAEETPTGETPTGETPTGETPTEETPTEEKPVEEESEAAEALKVAGLDMDEFSKEWTENGGLSDDSFKKLEAAGFPRKVVETYIAGVQQSNAAAEDVQAADQKIIDDVQTYAGGKDEYSKMVQWASANLTAQEQDTYNRIVGSKDADSIKWAVDGMKSRYAKAVGQTPNLISGDAQASATGVFESTQEVVQAMKDPRYGVDPAYTQKVADKLAKSNVF